MISKIRLTVRMPDELNLNLTNESKRLGISKNALILKILWDRVNEKKEVKNEQLNDF